MNVVNRRGGALNLLNILIFPQETNPNYWVNKLGNKHNILQQATYINLENCELWMFRTQEYNFKSDQV